ncbi:uncharacterized protein [Dermacentor albipictus]|uniref:uncharacterized protein isoform X2 n=1 Tax=Dermacentor albipictus TaxID=60249 RepID=UPI0031FD2122
MEKPIKEASQQPTLPHPNRLPAPKVSAYEVSELVLEKRLRFPINFLFWAKDLVFYLNSQLEGAPAAESQPPFEGRPAGFPLNELAAKVRRQLEDIIGGTNDEARSHLWDHCLNGALQALAAPSGGQNTGSCNVVGYMVCLQLLASRHPHIVTNALPKLRNLRSQHEGRPMACLALLWAASQAGLSSLSAGLAVWLELLMPVVGKRAYAPHVIDILSELLSRHPASKNGDENAGRACNLGVRSLFPLLDAVYGVGGRLPLSPERERALRDQLYPRIRDLCYAADPSRSAYFPSYLRRLGSGSAQLNAELLTSLEECLCRDPECLSVWRQLFERHAPQSMLLVQHLETKDAWRRLPCLTQRPPQATLISWRSTTPTSEGALRDALTQCQSTASKLEDLATLYQSLQKAAISAEQNPVAERQAFAVQLLHGVPDFEEGDFEDPTMGVPYAQEIFDYLAYLEERWPIKTGFLQVQPTVTPEMRSTLINWLMQVHWHYRLYHEILFLAVSLIDRVLQEKRVSRRKLQLLGVSAIFLASKLEMTWPPAVDDLIATTGNAYEREEVLSMERQILCTLDWSLGRPSPLQFLRRSCQKAQLGCPDGPLRALHGRGPAAHHQAHGGTSPRCTRKHPQGAVQEVQAHAAGTCERSDSDPGCQTPSDGRPVLRKCRRFQFKQSFSANTFFFLQLCMEIACAGNGRAREITLSHCMLVLPHGSFCH